MPKGKLLEKALNAKRVQNVSEPERYADGNGLYLVVDLSGAKRWVLRTVVRERRRDMGLGSLRRVIEAWPEVEAIAQVRAPHVFSVPDDYKIENERLCTQNERLKATANSRSMSAAFLIR